MFIEKLQELKNSKKIASFYTNEENTSRFNVGYIVEFTDEHFLVAAISPYGKYDGFVLLEVGSILRINTDSLYEEKMEKLTKHYNTTHECISIDGDSLLSGLIQYACTQNYIVSLELLNSGVYDVQGYVKDVTDEGCTIEQITEYGEDDGLTLIAVSDITKISCNSADEILLKILNSNSK